jgi:hypothetical protein
MKIVGFVCTLSLVLTLGSAYAAEPSFKGTFFRWASIGKGEQCRGVGAIDVHGPIVIHSRREKPRIIVIGKPRDCPKTYGAANVMRFDNLAAVSRYNFKVVNSKGTHLSIYREKPFWYIMKSYKNVTPRVPGKAVRI